MAEAAEDGAVRGALTSDAWLGGKLSLLQPSRGHRVGSDAALLAAAIDLREGRLVDVGSGVGAVGLAYLRRSPRIHVDLVEREAQIAGLAEENARRNALADRARILRTDLLDSVSRRAAGLVDETADAVVTNPPFFEAASVRASPDALRASAHVLPAREGKSSIEAWIRASLALLASGGQFAMIHRPEALSAILAAIGARLGGIALLPVYPREGAAAHRIVVSGVKGSRAPLRMAPWLVLHGHGGLLTAEAAAIHCGEALLNWGR